MNRQDDNNNDESTQRQVIYEEKLMKSKDLQDFEDSLKELDFTKVIISD